MLTNYVTVNPGTALEISGTDSQGNLKPSTQATIKQDQTTNFAIFFHNGGPLTLRDLILLDGKFGQFGALYVQAKVIHLQRVTILNTSTQGAGAIYSDPQSDPVHIILEDSVVDSSTAMQGAALHVSGPSVVEIRGTSILVRFIFLFQLFFFLIYTAGPDF
tara:strand:- start:6124 stop:6606 length:483 start_codon:yes stop_codon:yes gene_type:complete